MVDASEGEDSRFNRIVQTEEVVVRFALAALFVRVLLRHRYSAVVQFHLSIVGGVEERQSPRVHPIVLVPMFLLDLLFPSRMHPAVTREWENGLIVTSGHDCLIGSTMSHIIVAISVVL